MDKKTYEYMEKRTEKYKKLSEEKGRLERIKSDIEQHSVEGIIVNGSHYYFDDIRHELKTSTLQIIDKIIKELEIEMEEI
jgi:aspartate/glutamate racemase